MREFSVVTGAFSYTGRYIAERLLALGQPVRTLTRHPPSVADSGIDVAPLNCADRDGLVDALRGATTLYNTYWVRFPRGRVTFEQAVANLRSLFDAAGVAGVRRVVHISITNPSTTSPLPYFKGKGKVEETLARSGLSYAIIRPTLIYGQEDVLLNNIAWFLRRLAVFGIPGDGGYRVQPVSVEDVADLAVFAATQKDNLVRSEEHTSELQSPCNLVCRLLLEKKKSIQYQRTFGRRASLAKVVRPLAARLPILTR